MRPEVQELRGYGDIAAIRSKTITDRRSGISFIPFTGTEDQMVRVVQWFSRPSNYQYLFRYPGERPKTPKEIIAYHKREIKDRDVLLYELSALTSGPIGTIGMHSFDLWPIHKSVSVNILIDEPYRQNGYATHSMETLLLYAQMLGLNTVHPVVHWDNVDSVQLFRRFAAYADKEEGAPWIVFTVAMEQWRPQQEPDLVIGA